MAKRRNAAIVGLNRQFNPANGEPHTAKFLAKERETIADANLPNLCWLLRAEAYTLRHGNPTSYHEDIVPMHTTGLANFISAIADCIEKYIK